MSEPLDTPPAIQNIVMTASFGRELNIRLLAHKFRGEYNPPKFAAAIIRVKRPRCTALFFASGQAVIAGCDCFVFAPFF